MSRKITIDDLNMTLEEMEQFAAGARLAFGDGTQTPKVPKTKKVKEPKTKDASPTSDNADGTS